MSATFRAIKARRILSKNQPREQYECHAEQVPETATVAAVRFGSNAFPVSALFAVNVNRLFWSAQVDSSEVARLRSLRSSCQLLNRQLSTNSRLASASLANDQRMSAARMEPTGIEIGSHATSTATSPQPRNGPRCGSARGIRMGSLNGMGAGLYQMEQSCEKVSCAK